MEENEPSRHIWVYALGIKSHRATNNTNFLFSLLQPLQIYLMYFSNILTKLISLSHMEKNKRHKHCYICGKNALAICCGQLPAPAPHAGKKTATGEKPHMH